MQKFTKILVIAAFFISNFAKSQVLPSVISGLSLWLTGDSVEYSSGSFINKCYDLSANANHALQASPGNQPVTLAPSLNGHKSILFDGVDDLLSFTAINDIRTVFWVVNEDNSATSNYRSLLGHSSLYSFLRGANKEIWEASFAAPEVQAGQTKVNFSSVNGASTILPTNFSIISCATTGSVSAQNFSSDRGITGRVWQGGLLELIIYNEVLSPAQVSQVEQYLNDKYAPPVILPPDITVINSVCDTVIAPTGSFESYMWSTGAVTPTLSVNTSGKYWVRATNIFGQISSDTILVQYPTIAQPAKNYICSKDTLIWNTQLPNSDYTFLWQGGANDSLIKIHQPGTYFVTVNDAFGCSISSNTITITEDTFPLNASLGADSSLCSGNFITLTSGLSSSLTYTWSDGSNNDSLLITSGGQYSVVVTNTNNCIVKDTIIITYLGQAPIANFTTSIACNNSAVSFTDLSTTFSGNTITSYYWDFGNPPSAPSHTSSVNNPFHTFTDTGNYSIYLKIVTNVGCEQSITKTIHVAETPTVNFSSEIVCQNDSTAFKNQSINTTGYFTSSSLWNFGDIASGISNTSNFNSPKHLFSNSGNYFVKLITINNLGCKDSLTKYIAAINNSNYNLPATISGLKLWINGDCIHKTLSLADTCYDFSSNFNHAIQTNPNKQPISVPNSLNGHNILKFDGVDDYLKFNQITDIRTVFWVVYEDTNATSNYRSLLGHTNTLYDFLRGQNKEVLDSVNANSNILLGQTKINFSNINAKTTILPKNYALISTITTGTVGADNFSNERNIPNRFWQGNLAELIIYNQALNPVQVTQVEQYLNTKYAPDVKLPNDITVTNSFCDTTISANSSFVNYLWSNGATTTTISVNKSGKYWVNAVNIFGKESSDTIIVNLPDYHLPSQTSICAGNQLIWDTDLPKSNYNFQWQDNSPDSVFVINTAGNYYVKITDSFGCNITSDTTKITIDNFQTTATLGNDTILCSGNSIVLTSGMSALNSYTWSTGSNNDSLMITSPGGQYSVIVTNSIGCTAYDTIIVAVSGQSPIANFSTTIGCANKVVSFTNLSIPPSGNTIVANTWNFGESLSSSNTSTLSNPVHTYSNTGTYTISLTTETSAGCKQSIIKTINVLPAPTATFSFGTSCQNDTTSFLNQSTGITGYSITSSYWNFGDFPSPTYTSNVTSPKHIFTNVLTYSVTLIVTNSAGCASSVIKTITPKYEVKANFTNGSACANSATNFQSTSIIPPSGTSIYDWDFGIPNSNSNIQSPSKTYTNSGVYYVTLNVDGQNGCTSSITKMITVFLPPVANFSITSFCSKDTINVINTSTAQSGVLSSYDWKLNNVSFSAAQNPTLTLSTPTTYSVKLDVTNSFGCKDAKTYSLTIFPLPIVDFSTTPVAFYYINEPVSFTPSMTNASSYLWNMNGASTYSIQSPTETFNAEGSYTISLNLKDQNGCKSSKTKNITISKRYLDLAILNVSTTKDNDGFMTVVADIANYGSVPINSFKMSYQISDGGNIKEDWIGTLNPNSFYVYTFNATSASAQNSSNNITCVEIDKVNTIIDDITTNNSFCNSLNTDDIYVANPLPNPTDGDIVLPITLNRGFDYTIAIYNSVGQIQYEETTKKGIEGLNFVPLNTSSYARGAYIIKIMIDDKIFIKKFIKTSFE